MKTAKILTSIEEVLKYLDMAEILYEITHKRKELQPPTIKLFMMEITKKRL